MAKSSAKAIENGNIRGPGALKYMNIGDYHVFLCLAASSCHLIASGPFLVYPRSEYNKCMVMDEANFEWEHQF